MIINPSDFKIYEQMNSSVLSLADFHLCNRHVKLKKGRKYKGRKALVTDVIISCEGKILVLAYVLKKGTNEFLNTKPETRSYWKIDDLEWLE